MHAGSLAFASICFAVPLAGQQDSPKPQVLCHPKGLVRIEVPATWRTGTPEWGQMSNKPGYHQLMAFSSTVDGAFLSVFVLLVDNTYLRPAMQARHEAVAPANAHAVLELCRTTPPYLVTSEPANAKNPEPSVRVLVFRRAAGRGLHIDFIVPQKRWPALRADVIRIAQSAVVQCAELPRVLTERPLSVKNGVGVSSGPKVTATHLAKVRKLCAEIAGRLTRVHGSRWVDDREPVAVLVHADAAGHRPYLSDGASPLEVLGQVLPGRVLTVPDRGPGSEMRRELGRELASVVLDLDYDLVADPWMQCGEQTVAGMAAQTGKAFPFAPRDVLAKLPPLQWTLKELIGHKQLFEPISRMHCAYYVLLFQNGPAEYRKAYAAFLADLRTTTAQNAATAKHLLVLDQDKMRDAAIKLLQRLRPVPGVKW
ncbi:MAG: hypothetical protein KDC87_05625 [Planctomycetes bacterium]|nr:hypothetical protein [Planctomycetota bacterium]MCB9870359.1 hypothetical protein [Planctomycetota bacterium]